MCCSCADPPVPYRFAGRCEASNECCAEGSRRLSFLIQRDIWPGPADRVRKFRGYSGGSRTFSGYRSSRQVPHGHKAARVSYTRASGGSRVGKHAARRRSDYHTALAGSRGVETWKAERPSIRSHASTCSWRLSVAISLRAKHVRLAQQLLHARWTYATFTVLEGKCIFQQRLLTQMLSTTFPLEVLL